MPKNDTSKITTRTKFDSASSNLVYEIALLQSSRFDVAVQSVE